MIGALGHWGIGLGQQVARVVFRVNGVAEACGAMWNQREAATMVGEAGEAAIEG
jgi:hypothetical protein